MSSPSSNVCLAESTTPKEEPFRRLAGQVCKVYLGSFNAGAPIRSDLNPAGRELFEKEQGALLNDLYEIPQRSCDRKVRPARSGSRCCLGFRDQGLVPSPPAIARCALHCPALPCPAWFGSWCCLGYRD